MNSLKNIIIALLCISLLTACTSKAQKNGEELMTEEISAESAQDVLEQMDTLYASLDTEALPLQGTDTYAALDSTLITPQLVKDDNTAKKLALAIGNLLDAYGNGLGNYTGPEELSLGRTTTALWHTAPVEFTWEMSREGVFTASEQSHVLAALVKREIASGRTPCAVFYANDVKKTAEQLFGVDARITNQDIAPYYYYEKEGVYLLMEEITPETTYIPQILSYEKTADGYQAEAVLLEQREGKLTLHGDPMDKENFAKVTTDALHMRYTFKEDSERLVLSTLAVWRPEQ